MCWIGIAVAAVMGGAWVGKSAAVVDGAAGNGRTGSAVARERNGSAGGAQNDSRAASRKDEAELRKMASHALSTPRRTERYQRLMTLLDDTTADNWNTLWKEYIRQTLEEGRVHETEWRLFMNRVGEVAGPDAMEYFTHHGQEKYTFNRRTVLEGWAAMEPEHALEWLKAQPTEAQPAEFWSAVMGGATAKDSRLAMDLMGEIPGSITPVVVASAVDGLIQTEGLTLTAKLLEEKIAELPEGAAMPAQLRFFYEELNRRVARMKWLADSYPDMNSRQPSLERLAERFGGGAPPEEAEGE